MTKHIRNLITVMATAITCFAGPSAKADPVPEQTPMTTANSFSSSSSDDITTHFLEQAFESARINSPFASFTAEPSEPAFQSATLAGKMVDYASRFLGTRYRRGATGPKRLIAQASQATCSATSASRSTAHRACNIHRVKKSTSTISSRATCCFSHATAADVAM